MRKFKVVKKWPGGPEVGTELLNNRIDDSVFYHPGGIKSWVEHELEGFVEEVKEPEVFWVLDATGKACPSVKEYDDIVPNWLRFRTKESAEKFAKALKDSHKLEKIEYEESNSGTFYIQEKGVFDGRAEIEDIIDSLNDRVTD